MGPFKFQFKGDDSNGAPDVSLSPNPYAWSKVANMLYLDSPVGVGLSHSIDKADYVMGDRQTAEDADEFLRGFFKR